MTEHKSPRGWFQATRQYSIERSREANQNATVGLLTVDLAFVPTETLIQLREKLRKCLQ